jgi:serine/threonine protein kinase
MLQLDATANPVEDESKSKCVAIKKVKNVFENEVYAHRILREIRLLRILRGHKNVSQTFHLFLNYLVKLDCEIEDDHAAIGSKDFQRLELRD